MPRWLLVTLVGMLALAVLAGGTGWLASLLHRQANLPGELALRAGVYPWRADNWSERQAGLAHFTRKAMYISVCSL
jgi:hypothetical protein